MARALDPRLLLLAQAAVDRRVAQVFDGIPCFCTPQRPDLGREEWCCKHVVLKRLDIEGAAREVAEAYEDKGT